MNAIIQQPKLPDGWNWANVKCLYKPISPKKKLNLKEYLKEGAFPIVDQSKGLVGGYHNKESDVNVISSPVVIFGDHTTEIKYIDFDFITGADGTKILQPDPSKVLPLFFYFALRNLRLKTDGYRRHFKDLNKKMIPLPPLEEQKRIATKLNEQMYTVEEARKIAEEQLRAAKTLPNTYLKQIFASNKDDLPHGWKLSKLGEVCILNPKRPQLVFRSDATTTFLPMASVDAKSGSIATAEQKRFSEVSKGYTYIEEGDVLFAKITPSMQNGKHAVAHNLINGFAFGSTEFHVLRPTKEVIADWIHQFLRQKSILVEAKSHFRGTAGQQRVPASFLNELSIPLPPLAEQKQIAARLNEQMKHTTKLIESIEQELDMVKALPAVILRKALAGEL